jgi:hypothetical protein
METIGINKPDNLYANINFPEVRSTRSIPDGISVKRGDILGINYRPIVTGGTPDSVALENIGENDTVRICSVAESGEFNANALFTGDDTTPMDWETDLRVRCNIYVRSPAP